MNIPFGNITVTIYNRYQYKNSTGKIITTWKRSVINGCGQIYKSVLTSNNGIQLAGTQQMIQIPHTENYVDEYEWDSMINDSRADRFTAQSGDLIVLGEVEDEVDEFSVIEDIEKKYASLSFKIKQVNKNYGVGYPIPHIQVVE